MERTCINDMAPFTDSRLLLGRSNFMSLKQRKRKKSHDDDCYGLIWDAI